MAYGMQGEAQEAFDLGRETADTRKRYGDGEFATLTSEYLAYDLDPA